MQRKKIHDVNLKHLEPDNEMLVWEKWIRIRNDETTKLSKKVNKPPIDLTMNLLEKTREQKEWKTVFEHAQIEKKALVRGQPWDQPLRLKQECYCKPVYEVHRTRAEMGKPTIINHVSVPEYIQKVEKGLKGESNRAECKQINAEFIKYKNKREDELKERIIKMDPFRPRPSGLIVKGTKAKIPPKKLPPLPNIIITPMDAKIDVSNRSIIAVRINNTVIFKDMPGQDLGEITRLKCEPWHESSTSWSYYFNTPVKRAGRCKLYLYNLGTVTLRYCWKKLKQSMPFIPEDVYEQVFFFNKNEEVISPGQSKEISFTFLADKPGIFSGMWELNFCNISFEISSERLIVNLNADSVENLESIQRKCAILKDRIRHKAVTNVVREIISDVVMQATAVVPQQYPYKELFLESELFVMKNPVCFYHQSEALKMRKLYCEMLPGIEWDLSISTWREAMMSKDYDERMKYFELLKNSHADFLKPWYEGETLLEDKYRAVNLLLGQMADMFDKKYAELHVLYCPPDNENESQRERSELSIILDPATRQKISNLFYVHAYEYFAVTIEMCAGILSSLDLNRWVEFDFCRW